MTTPTVTTPYCRLSNGLTVQGIDPSDEYLENWIGAHGSIAAVRGVLRDLHGLTLRQALKALRQVDWGSTGYMLPATLSDGSTLAVHNATTDDGQGILPGVHVAVREWVRTGKTRTYTL